MTVNEDRTQDRHRRPIAVRASVTRSVAVLAVAALVAAACSTADDGAVSPEPTTTEVPPSTATEPSVAFLALGDSYTIGEGVRPDERWPVQLGRAIDATGFHSVDVEIIALTGWTTGELATSIDAVNPQGPFDLVSLLIGVNNQFRGLDIDEYETELVDLVQRAIGLAGGDPSNLIMVSIPDWGVTPFGGGYDAATVAREIDAFNAVAEAVADRVGAAWVDVTGISRSGADGLVAADGLHPSADQYGLWVEVILPAALEALG